MMRCCRQISKEGSTRVIARGWKFEPRSWVDGSEKKRRLKIYFFATHQLSPLCRK